MIDDQHVARVVEAKADDLQRRIDQLLAPGDLAAVVLEAPDLAGDVVAVDVRPAQLRQPRVCEK